MYVCMYVCNHVDSQGAYANESLGVFVCVYACIYLGRSESECVYKSESVYACTDVCTYVDRHVHVLR